MKCAEVMEWMHRYLDHDLSQEEMLEMFRHIDDCPSCAEVLDRLTTLSRQLEELPDVKPPFSLVDSILPQLDQLDRGVREEPVMAGAEDPKIVPFTRQSTHSKKAKGKGASMAARTGIGAAAAAVILLFAIFKMPDSMPAADVDQALQSTASEAAGTMMNESADKAAPADTGQQNSADGGAELFFTEQAPAASEPAGDELNSALPAAEDAPGEAAGTDPGPAMQKEAVPTEAPSAKRNNASAPPAVSPRAGSGDNNSAADARTYSQIFTAPDQEDAAADKAAPEEGALQSPTAVEPGAMGMLPALVNSHSSWPSPDGRYTAELAGQQIVIYSVPPGGVQEERTALTSLPLEGTWVSGEWSQDGSRFTYITQQQDGTQAPRVYTVPAAVPATPAASAAPSASAAASAAPSPVITPDAATSNK